jgi:hypothetical protein
VRIAREDGQEEAQDLESFDKLVEGMLDESVSTIQHAAVFINWQLKQESTVVHQYSGQPNLQVLPPQTEDQLKYSKERKAEFAQLYRYSVETQS